MANPHSADTPHWEAAFEHYYQDRVDASYAEIVPFGVGEGGDLLRWYRVIEAEAVTRSKSRTEEIAPWLFLEFIPGQTMGLEKNLTTWALEACDEVAQRLGWTHSVKTMLSILAKETDAPWAANPYGYCVSKEPYEKICLPDYLIDDEEEFRQAVAHEYAHVISTNIADEYAPRWIEEAVSVLVERRFDKDTWKRFCSESKTWLSERDLENVLTDRTEDDEESRKEEIWTAYQQAGWMGRYLAHQKGDASLGELLREIANETTSKNIARIVRRQDRTESALVQVYGLTKKELFERSLHWLRNLAEDSL